MSFTSKKKPFICNKKLTHPLCIFCIAAPLVDRFPWPDRKVDRYSSEGLHWNSIYHALVPVLQETTNRAQCARLAGGFPARVLSYVLSAHEPFVSRSIALLEYPALQLFSDWFPRGERDAFRAMKGFDDTPSENSEKSFLKQIRNFKVLL